MTDARWRSVGRSGVEVEIGMGDRVRLMAGGVAPVAESTVLTLDWGDVGASVPFGFVSLWTIGLWLRSPFVGGLVVMIGADMGPKACIVADRVACAGPWSSEEERLGGTKTSFSSESGVGRRMAS